MYYQLDGHEFKQTLGHSGGQRSLVSHSSWGHREPDTLEAERLQQEKASPVRSVQGTVGSRMRAGS